MGHCCVSGSTRPPSQPGIRARVIAGHSRRSRVIRVLLGQVRLRLAWVFLLTCTALVFGAVIPAPSQWLLLAVIAGSGLGFAAIVVILQQTGRRLIAAQGNLGTIRADFDDTQRRLMGLAAMDRIRPGVTIVYTRSGVVRSFTSQLVTGGPDEAAERIHPGDLPGIRSALRDAERSPGADHPVGFRLRSSGGEWLYLEGTVKNALREPGIGGFVLHAEDVTRNQRLVAKLRAQALFDPVTGLANRTHFLESMQRMLAEDSDQSRALLLLDLDRFKLVNDTLGHSAGDGLLRVIARRLLDVAGEDAMVGRLGGDEFTVMVRVASLAEARELADQILAAIRVPLDLEGNETIISASIGIVLGNSSDVQEELLRKADAALYRAKGAGRGQYAVFDQAADPYTVERLRFESEFRQALERDQFYLVFQPEVDLTSGRVVGAEALVRWNHLERGVLSPAEFVPLAEETGEILPLGSWILSEACREAARWARFADEPFTIAVNLSAREFEEEALVSRAAEELDRSGLPPEALRLEITETALLRNGPVANGALAALKEIGVQLALDDFGVGYSSLSYLSRLPVDVVKIDQSFVAGMEADDRQRAIVNAVVQLAHACGAQIVAEGVESSDQVGSLQTWGCRSAQGFLFSAGLSARDFTTLLRRRHHFEDQVVRIPAAPEGSSDEADASVVLFDPVTGLPGSVLFDDRLAIALALAERHTEAVGIGFLRVGHPTMSQHGDPDCIARVGRAVRVAVRASDTVAHLGRGLFALMLNDASSNLGARSAASRIINQLEGELGQPGGRWSAVMGFVVSTPSHQAQRILMAQAHAAFTRAMSRSGPSRSTIEEAVKLAIYDPEYDELDDSEEDDGYSRAS